MKAKSIDQAKSMAKSKSLETKYKGEAIYIIYCNGTEFFYVETDSLIRLWEQLIGYYENGVYTTENQTHKTMKVTDLNDYLIEIMNLKKAIKIARQYKEYRHEDKRFSEFDKRQKAYWTDMYEKLTTIKKRLNNN